MVKQKTDALTGGNVSDDVPSTVFLLIGQRYGHKISHCIV
jgi:hypothetical protein